MVEMEGLFWLDGCVCRGRATVITLVINYCPLDNPDPLVLHKRGERGLVGPPCSGGLVRVMQGVQAAAVDLANERRGSLCWCERGLVCGLPPWAV
jgi:hypothetical protein